MPFTASEINQLGTMGLDLYMKNNPVDQVGVDRPWLRQLMKTKRSFGGGKQYVVEQLRTGYNSNFKWYFGDDGVTYNRRDTVKQAQYTWGGCHDGFSLNEDLMFANGIVIADSAPRGASDQEKVQLTNLFEENIETLRLGFEQAFDSEMHQDGTQDAKSVAGLDYLISTAPATGTVGGINPAADTWWRNQYKIGVAANSMIDEMEIMYRKTARVGGKAPDFIMAGSTFVDAFRNQAISQITRYTDNISNGTEVDPSITGLAFHGIPILWNPVFEDLDAALSPTVLFEKRAYMINTKHLRLRPADGHDMIKRNPDREYNKYVYYWGLTWKGSMCMNQRNCHGVISVA